MVELSKYPVAYRCTISVRYTQWLLCRQCRHAIERFEAFFEVITARIKCRMLIYWPILRRNNLEVIALSYPTNVFHYDNPL